MVGSPTKDLFGPHVDVHPEAIIEPGTTLSSDSDIDAGAYIIFGAWVGPRVHVGANKVIRENAVIGGWGFGFARSKGEPTIRIPHLGSVRIGRDVEVGALTTVCSGTIDPTVVENNVRINDHAHIAHNCHLEEKLLRPKLFGTLGPTVI